MDRPTTSFLRAAAEDLGGSGPPTLSDDDLREVLTAATRLYARRAEASGDYPLPVDQQTTATEVLTLVCEMIRAVDLNMFDLSMWYRRPK